MKFGIIFEQEVLHKEFIKNTNNLKAYRDYNIVINCFNFEGNEVATYLSNGNRISDISVSELMVRDLHVEIVILVGIGNSVNDKVKSQNVIISSNIISLKNNVFSSNIKLELISHKISSFLYDAIIRSLKIGREQPKVLLGNVLNTSNLTDQGLISHLIFENDIILCDAKSMEIINAIKDYRAQFLLIKGIGDRFLDLDNKYNDLNTHYVLQNTTSVLKAVLNSPNFK